MSWLPFFGKKTPADVAKKYRARAIDKRAYQPDRWDALRALAAAPGPETAEVLLGRFAFRIDPSITDQEEKDLAYQGIVAAGEAAIPAVRAALRKSSSVAIPLKILAALTTEAAVTDELLELIGELSTDYERDPDRKIQLVAALEDRKDPRIAQAAERFFVSDANEPTRYNALQAILAQDDAIAFYPKLVERLFGEDSTRIRGAILDICAERGIKIPLDRIIAVRQFAPRGTVVDEDGTVRRLG